MKNPIQFYYAATDADYEMDRRCQECDVHDDLKKCKKKLKHLKSNLDNKRQIEIINENDKLKEENEILKYKVSKMQRRFNDMAEEYKEKWKSYKY